MYPTCYGVVFSSSSKLKLFASSVPEWLGRITKLVFEKHECPPRRLRHTVWIEKSNRNSISYFTQFFLCIPTGKSIDFECHGTVQQKPLVLAVGFDPSCYFICGQQSIRYRDDLKFSLRPTDFHRREGIINHEPKFQSPNLTLKVA